MKRIVKLKGQMVLLVIISIILSWIICMFLFGNTNISKKTYERKYNKAKEENKRFADQLKSTILNKTDEEIIKILNEKFPKERSHYVPDFYFTDENGAVLSSNNESLPEKIDFKNKKDKTWIYDNLYILKSVIKVRDNRYVVTIQTKYLDDNHLMIVWAVLSMIIFYILSYKIVNYINKLSLKVKNIASGDLKIRVPVKYNNEITTLARNINFMTEELEKQDIKQKEFITNISHDLRTPLTTAIGYIDMIKEKKYENQEELNKYIEITDSKLKYLKSMMEDFFYYSKLSSDDTEFEIKKINLNECINQLLYGEEEEFLKKSLKLNVDLCSQDLYIKGDPMLIAKSIENLISNAMKYSKKDTEVTVSLNKSSENCVLTVRNVPYDEITDEDVNEMFTRLYKKDKSRKKEGSGLGLAITKEIIKKHNGTIKADKNGEYLEFQILLKTYEE